MLYPKAVGNYVCLRKMGASVGVDLEDEVIHVYNPQKVVETLKIEEDDYVFLHREDILGVLLEIED